MSEHSHIDNIFREGLGEKKFSTADAMWQRMEADLDKEGGRKRRPFLFFFAAVALIATGFFATLYFNRSTDIAKTAAPAADALAGKGNTITSNTLQQTDLATAGSKIASNRAGTSDIPAMAVVSRRNAPIVLPDQHRGWQIPGNEFGGTDKTTAPEIIDPIDYDVPGGIYLEKVIAQADLIAVPSTGFHSAVIAPLKEKKNIQSIVRPVEKRKTTASSSRITIEAVGGVDLIRLNRKAGYYVGVRLNKKLESGSSFSVGVNYASHIISDRYRVKTKPAEQRSSDARINNISSLRLPVYLQRQMGTSKFSMMVGLVPTYITQAEVYNVPNSYIGDPDPYRKFGLDDINRFNVLFGAGLKYSPTNWIALELSGSYGLTGMVKDGYKNLSRVNDNFKSIQLGAAFRLK